MNVLIFIVFCTDISVGKLVWILFMMLHFVAHELGLYHLALYAPKQVSSLKWVSSISPFILTSWPTH